MLEDSWILIPENVEAQERFINEDQQWVKLGFTFIIKWEQSDVNGKC